MIRDTTLSQSHYYFYVRDSELFFHLFARQFLD